MFVFYGSQRDFAVRAWPEFFWNWHHLKKVSKPKRTLFNVLVSTQPMYVGTQYKNWFVGIKTIVPGVYVGVLCRIKVGQYNNYMYRVEVGLVLWLCTVNRYLKIINSSLSFLFGSKIHFNCQEWMKREFLIRIQFKNS